MRKSLKLSLAMAAALGAGVLGIAAAEGMDGGGWHGHHGMSEGMHQLGALNLSDSQRASIKQMVQSSFAQSSPQRDTLRQQREAFEAMMPTSAGYQAAAGNLANAEANAARDRVTRGAALRAQIYGILSPAQRTQLANMRAQHEARRQQWQQFKAQHPVSNTGSTAQ